MYTLGNRFKHISERPDAPSIEDMRMLQHVWGAELDDALRDNNISISHDGADDEDMDSSAINFFPKPLQYFKDAV